VRTCSKRRAARATFSRGFLRGHERMFYDHSGKHTEKDRLQNKLVCDHRPALVV
jgi:hypothetical protein